MSEKSILTQATEIAASKDDGLTAGVVVDGKDIGAEASLKVDPGEPGGLSFGAGWRWMKAKGHQAAAFFRWTPKGHA